MPRKAQLVLPTIDTCSWRTMHNGSPAECGLIGQLIGPSSALVSDEACAACCRSFPPSPKLLNPTVASLLYRRATTLLEIGGNAECSRAQAGEVRARAERSLNINHPANTTLIPARAQTECCWLGKPLISPFAKECGPSAAPVFACHHRDHQQTTEAGCRCCRDWTLRRPRSRLLALDELIPAPKRRCGPAVRSWAVGVTTSPRRDSTLEWTLDSLVRAGWPMVQLFVDGTIQLPPRYAHLPITWREDGLGAWPAWYFALAELVLKQPDADAYVMLQDDVMLFDRECLRAYLEKVLWPGEHPGIVSLFTSISNPKPGWFDAQRQWHFSAQGLVLAPGTARALLSDSNILRTVMASAGGVHIPVPEIVSQWVFDHAVDVWYANPSLLQHIGNTSTIWMDAQIHGGRRAAWYSGSVETEFAADESLADFPEEAFVCAPQLQEAYRRQVEEGRTRMRQSSVVICGLARNARVYLPRTAARIERLGEMFKDYRVLFVEQDSSDATADFLADWRRCNSRLEILGDDRDACEPHGMHGSMLTARVADGRNRYRARIVEQYRDFDYVIVVDADLAGGWSYDGVAHTFGTTDWDGVGSYGLLRARNRAPGRNSLYQFAAAAFRPAASSAAVALDHCNDLDLSRGEPLLPVESCYGGMFVYRTVCMGKATYVGADCEHIGFHQQLRRAGCDRLFLNPSQIVLYAPL